MQSELVRKIMTYGLSTVVGAAVAVVFLLLSAFLMYALGAPLYYAEYLSLMSMGLGCMVSGFISGRIKRRGGLKIGFRCAVIFLLILAIGAVIAGQFNGNGAIARILTAVVTGCTGGVLGVNRQ